MKMAQKTKLTAARLREVLDYCPETGEFSRRSTSRASKPVGRVRPDGYLVISVDNQLHLAHRLAWLHVYGVWPSCHIDHINGNPADNRISNLREATNGENMQNQRRAHRNSQTGALGGHPHKENGNYVAQIRVDGKTRHIGSYRTAEEAHYAYLQAKRRLHPNGEIAKSAEIEPEKIGRKLPEHGFAGVEERGGRFRAFFYRGGKRINVGTLDTADEASQARKTAMKDT